MIAFVVDTNVAIAANGRNTTASIKCQEKCVETLEEIVKNCIVIDDNEIIMNEYAKHLNHSGGPNIGDFFFRHIFDNQGFSEKVERVKITPLDNHGNFQEFPNTDPALNGFDLNDKKFVAVALTSLNNPTIINATDSDWANYGHPLSNHVNVRELC